MNFKKLRKHYKWAIVLLLLPLCVLGCGNGADAETTPPKSPYELETMITANDADIAALYASLEDLQSEIDSIEAVDYSADIAGILARLAVLEARLNPTPTPTATGSGGVPAPTTPPAAGDITITVLDKPAAIATSGSYSFTVRIENDSPSHAVCTVSLTLNAYNGDTTVNIAAVNVVEELSEVTADYYLPDKTECEQVRLTMEGLALGSGSSKILTIMLSLDQTGSFEWIPSFSITGS